MRKLFVALVLALAAASIGVAPALADGPCCYSSALSAQN